MRENRDMRGVNDNWNEFVKVLRLDVDQDSTLAPPCASSARNWGSKALVTVALCSPSTISPCTVIA